MDTSPLVRRELLALSIRNAGRSIPVLLLGATMIAWNGVDSAQHDMAALVAVLAAATCIWRVAIGKRFAESAVAERESLQRFSIGLALCSLLPGVMWAVATFGIYPSLSADGKALHLVAVTGLAALAGHFMSLAGHTPCSWCHPSVQ